MPCTAEKNITPKAAFAPNAQSLKFTPCAKVIIDSLCPECAELEAYARMRSDKCPFMETKTFCSNCKVHCYKPVMREKIREVMRFSGPRMLFSHPMMAISHVIESKKEKKRLEESR